MTLSEFLDFPELNNYSIEDEDDIEKGVISLIEKLMKQPLFILFKHIVLPLWLIPHI